ncbi:hypothetical protein C8J56DRAFT_1030705 [Mycena floridula]|nr:hypothetical protein C8J56DRAFT_1030705 [Mycena floridula]
MTREQYNSGHQRYNQALLIRTWVQHNQRPLTDIWHRNLRERLVRMERGVSCCEGSLLSPVLLRIVVHSSLSIQGPARERRNILWRPTHAVGAGSPFFRFFLASVSCRGFIGWRDRGLAEKMTRWDKELVLALCVDSNMLHCLDYTIEPLRNETASLAVKIMSWPIHGFTRSTDRTTQSKERAWSSKQAAVMVFEEAATRIKICTSSYTTIERQPVFRPSDKSGDYGRLGLRADE